MSFWKCFGGSRFLFDLNLVKSNLWPNNLTLHLMTISFQRLGGFHSRMWVQKHGCRGYVYTYNIYNMIYIYIPTYGGWNPMKQSPNAPAVTHQFADASIEKTKALSSKDSFPLMVRFFSTTRSWNKEMIFIEHDITEVNSMGDLQDPKMEVR